MKHLVIGILYGTFLFILTTQWMLHICIHTLMTATTSSKERIPFKKPEPPLPKFISGVRIFHICLAVGTVCGTLVMGKACFLDTYDHTTFSLYSNKVCGIICFPGQNLPRIPWAKTNCLKWQATSQQSNRRFLYDKSKQIYVHDSMLYWKKFYTKW